MNPILGTDIDMIDDFAGSLRRKIKPGPSMWHLNETTSTDANQFKASGYLDTGKLGQAVSMYGNAAGTAGSTLTFNRGLQISGNNYEHINTNQGTISFWVKPNWNSNDGVSHYFYIDDASFFKKIP